MLGSALLLLGSWSHVPTYKGGNANCFRPKHEITTSQVTYIKGSGGLEVELKSLTEPLDILRNEIIDFDVTFRDDVSDVYSTFALYIGCGGCHPNDPIMSDRVVLNSLQPAHIEPFTQTRYYRAFAEDERTFHSSSLYDCVSNNLHAHWSIRLVDYQNRTDGKPLVWAAVVGLDEKFTPLELVEFPIYILRNHGSYWNEQEWTVYFSFFVFSPLLFFLLYMSSDINRGTWRCIDVLYLSALMAFTAAIIENFAHLCIAQSGVSLSIDFLVALLGAVIGPNALFVAIVMCSWHASIAQDAEICSEFNTMRTLCVVSELAAATASYFAIGAGLFVGPALFSIAALYRAIVYFWFFRRDVSKATDCRNPTPILLLPT